MSKSKPKAKMSRKDRLKDVVRDPWRKLREKPGVTIQSTARRD